MTDQPFIDRLVAELGRHLPAGLEQARDELERSARAILQEGISRLDLISREEFDVQQQVLARTRAKLEALEKEVAELERRLTP
ncbi:MAG: accessory factor UbiK family protein [Alcanivoracaceae bacterium]|jgi:ubiquinone biosynthesis accessory factor UbiK